ncbi:hypothetical protein M9Y10_021286 [Tritrichomonas musculus]|uniref:Protein kinase domain-containing protein n=1 Tax=Tritrichomonas musculus TaxID=1915356 RepID=A0ABR2HEF1_9EUKA
MEDFELIIWKLSRHGYEFRKMIGYGGFSSVFLCHSKKYLQNFAVKRTIKEKLNKDEFKTMVALDHANIIKLYDSFEDEDTTYLVMEYCPNGTLRQKGKLTYSQFVYYAKQILEALAYCHSKNIAHRDIKPDNFFLDSYDNAKLADFGMSRYFEDDKRSNQKCGSIRYFAPEMFQADQFDPFKADIWALGISFFLMATGTYPFSCRTNEQLKQDIINSEIDFAKYDIDPRIQFLISKMVEKQVDLRFTTDQLLQLPIFQSTTNKTKLPMISINSSRKFSPESFHKSFSMNFNSYHNSISDENEKKQIQILKLHSYRGLNQYSLIQKISRHHMSSK